MSADAEHPMSADAEHSRGKERQAAPALARALVGAGLRMATG